MFDCYPLLRVGDWLENARNDWQSMDLGYGLSGLWPVVPLNYSSRASPAIHAKAVIAFGLVASTWGRSLIKHI